MSYRVYAKDLGMWFRSSWEASIARLLKYLGFMFEYEPCRLSCGMRNYTPDFYLPDEKIYLEVKGVVNEHAWKQLDVASNCGVNVIAIGPSDYNLLEKIYGGKVPNWKLSKKRSDFIYDEEEKERIMEYLANLDPDPYSELSLLGDLSMKNISLLPYGNIEHVLQRSCNRNSRYKHIPNAT